MTTYTDKELLPFGELIADARQMHEADRAKFHDEGTCVLGAGIAVWYKAPRKRNAARKVLIGQAFQGNSGSWKAAQRAIAHLKSEGLDAFWYDGVMD